MLAGRAVGWVGVGEPLACPLGRRIGARLDAELGRERCGLRASDADVGCLLGDDPRGAHGVFDPRDRGDGAGRPVVGHTAGVDADDAVGLDGSATTGVEPFVRLQSAKRGFDGIERRGRRGTVARGVVEGGLSGGRRATEPRARSGATVDDDAHAGPRMGRRISLGPENGRPFTLVGEIGDDMSYEKVEVPAEGERITADAETGELDVPSNPIIPIIHGDGIGTDVGPAAQKVLDAAAEATGRSINWMRLYAGESARERYDENLPDDTVDAIREFRVAIKGPLTTPVGSGFRSLNVALRKKLDLYANVRPTYHLDGVPSPVKSPEKMDMVNFRENTEDVYAGIEWEAGTDEVERVREFIEEEMGFDSTIHDGPVGIGVKPITEFGTKRLVSRAIQYAIDDGRDSVTLVHKGNIMKFTEAAFRDWGYEVAEEEFGDATITEDELWEEYDGEAPDGVVVVKDRIADNMLQQLLTRTEQYDVLAMPNLNGDYLSDSAGAQIGGLGIAPGANLGDGRVLAEPVHGSAPKYAGEDKVNPTAMILSGRLMLEQLGWDDAADLVRDAVEETISAGKVTYDLHRQIEGGTKLATSEYADAVVENIETLS
jgi:isocitrate dehydrogenase